jgi:exodeoxyribonuclease V
VLRIHNRYGSVPGKPSEPPPTMSESTPLWPLLMRSGVARPVIADEILTVRDWLRGKAPESVAELLTQEAMAAACDRIAEEPGPQSAGFTLTADQQAAVDGILQDIRKKGACPVLCGYAGTGKTVTTAALVSELIDREWRTVVATPTHKARSQVERALRNCGAMGFEAVTVHRLLGLKQVRDKDTGKEKFAPDPKGKNMLSEKDRWDEDLWERVPIKQIDVVIVDETSMLSSNLYDLLIKELGGRPVVFVGDDRQLLPVGEDQVCPAFVKGTSIYRLTDVLRHDGAILNLATATRQMALGRARFFPLEGGGSKVVAYRNREHWLNALLEMAATSDAMSDSDYCRALAFPNADVEELNKKIHQRRYGESAPEFLEGMTCVTVDAIPSPTGGAPLLNSTMDVLIQDANRELHRFTTDSPDDDPWDTWELTVSVPGDGLAPVTFRVIPKESERRWWKSLREIADKAKAADLPEDRRALWGAYFERKDSVGQLQPASALTVHKSQGSTFRHVFLHWSIDGWGSAPTAQQNQLAYVGITRAAETLHVVADR